MRLSVVIFPVPSLLMLYGFLRHGPADIATSSHASTEWLVTRGLSIAGILLLFVGWSLGGDRVGHDRLHANSRSLHFASLQSA
jgi:hypothetical protein